MVLSQEKAVDAAGNNPAPLLVIYFHHLARLPRCERAPTKSAVILLRGAIYG
jgi:hypothetical protein